MDDHEIGVRADKRDMSAPSVSLIADCVISCRVRVILFLPNVALDHISGGVAIDREDLMQSVPALERLGSGRGRQSPWDSHSKS
jgi:hypothetical protein